MTRVFFNKILWGVLVIIWLLWLVAAPGPAGAQAPATVNLYFFWGQGCPHCHHEKEWLDKLAKKYDHLKIHSIEVTAHRENRELLSRVAARLEVKVSGVPFTVVGNEYFIGWLDEAFTGAAIEQAVNRVSRQAAPDPVAALLPPAPQPSALAAPGKAIPDKIKVPLVGEIETQNLSLGALTIIFGALDGFNPCAMWVLMLLIGLLLGMEDVKKRYILGTTFIAASAFVYFLFMCAWLNVFLFLGLALWVRTIIGVIALAAGFYNLREYFVNPEAACKVTGGERRHKIFDKLSRVTQHRKFLLALAGVILLAFAVNLVELICSMGLPVVYTQILSLTPMPAWQYYAYLVLYIVIFMLDDILVFFLSMITLQAAGLSTRYKRFSNLVGGVIMLALGALLILKPEWLMFG